MVTISRIVEKLVEDSLFIQEALIDELINYASLAEKFKPLIEKEMKCSVKESAIMMSLRRLREKLEKKIVSKIFFDKNSEVVVRSDLIEITINKSKDNFKIIKEISQAIDKEKDFFTWTQGINQITILTNKKNGEKFNKIVPRKNIIREIEDLSMLSIVLPETAPDNPGYFYLITRTFAWENIPIVEIVSTLNELNIFVKTSDVPKSFRILKEIIDKNSGIVG
jgi:hypothetical protein